MPTSKGFPEPSPTGRRDAFATFGGPHILSLVTEVAIRCLKAVRRQKFNYHRRARPEALGGRLTLVKCGSADKIGCAKTAFEATFAEIPGGLKKEIIKHNHHQNAPAMVDMRRIACPDKGALERLPRLQPAAADGVPRGLADASRLWCWPRYRRRWLRHHVESFLRHVRGLRFGRAPQAQVSLSRRRRLFRSQQRRYGARAHRGQSGRDQPS